MLPIWPLLDSLTSYCTLAFLQFFKPTILPSVTGPLYKLFPLSGRFPPPAPGGPGKSYHLRQRTFSEPLRSFCRVVLQTPAPVVCRQLYLCDELTNTCLSNVRKKAVSAFAHLKSNTTPVT